MTSLVELGLSNAVASLLLAVVAVFVGLVCRRPALVHALWLLVLVKLVTPPLVRIPIPRGGPAAAVVRADVADTTDPLKGLPEDPPAADGEDDVAWPEDDLEAQPVRAVVEFDPDDLPAPAEAPSWLPEWPAMIGGVWLAGSAGWFLLAGLRLWRFGRLLRLGRPAPRALTRRVERLVRRVGLSWRPPVVLLPGRLAPMVWGVDNPLLLLPEELPEQVAAEALDTLLLHELAHLKRRDHWVRLLEFFTLGLYWWLPVVWYARRELREVEEQCCDAWVVRTLPGAGRLYAGAIVDALDFLAPPSPPVPPLASGLGQVADLKRRLTMIMRGSIPHQLGWSTSLVVLALAALMLPVVPGFAQDTPKPKISRSGAGDDELERMDAELKRRMEELEALRRKMDVMKKARAAEAEARKVEDARAERDARRAAEADRKKIEEAVRKAEAAVREKLKEVERKIQEAARSRASGKDRRGSGDERGNAVIRIEITGVPGEMKELVEQLRRILHKDSRVTINVDEHRGDRPRVIVAPRGKKGDGEEKSREVPPRVDPPVPPKPATGAKPGSAGSDRRIENLERRLESIMRELESLRRELRRPGSGRPGDKGRDEEGERREDEKAPPRR